MKSDKSINHIAFIMDGNGRWASERHLLRNTGHKEGIKAMMRVVDACLKRAIPYVSFYAFSTENKFRPKVEVLGLMKLMEEYFGRFADEFNTFNARLNVLGDVSYFSDKLQRLIRDAEEQTKANTGGVVNIALNYGGRDELERAAMLKANSGGKLSDFLYTASQPDPDVLVRTGGEKRLSNFMLYQLAYTELFFTDTYWPDFSEDELSAIIDEYYKRNRRFGK